MMMMNEKKNKATNKINLKQIYPNLRMHKEIGTTLKLKFPLKNWWFQKTEIIQENLKKKI